MYASYHTTLTAPIPRITQIFSPTQLSHSISPVPITVVSGHLPDSQGCTAHWIPPCHVYEHPSTLTHSSAPVPGDT